MGARTYFSRGFTLIELMVTLTILAIMMGIGIPSFKSFTANQKVKTAGYEMMASIMMARSEAIKRNVTATLTPVGGSWVSGWTVAAGGITLHSQSAFDAVTITQKGASNSEISPTAITFGTSGRPAAKGSFEFTGTGSAVRCVKIDSIGIPTSSNGSCS